jgi:alpha-mannosidase
VPDAQCLGKRVFEYAVMPHAGTWQEAQVWRHAHQHNVPLHAVQTGAHDGDLPAEMSFVEVEPAELVVTAIKKAESDDRLVVRFFNTTDGPVKGKVIVNGAKSGEIVNLNEEQRQTLKVTRNGSVTLDVSGKKIVTLAFRF